MDSNGRYVQYDERTSKNGMATMRKFQPEHFRPAVKNYEIDVVDTFERYYKHLPKGMTKFFLAVIDNPRTVCWYARHAMGECSLALLVKQIFEENGLDPKDYSNKSGRATLVTRMAESRVPNEVGRLVTCHHSEQAYARYDRSKEAKVRAAQRCATEDSLTYVQALEEETHKLKVCMVEGSSGESPRKLLKSLEEADVECSKEFVALKLNALQIDVESPSAGSPSVTALTTKSENGKRVRTVDNVDDGSKWAWMKHFDWEGDLKLWEEGKSLNINPISGLLGKLVNCDGITINFHGAMNFKA